VADDPNSRDGQDTIERDLRSERTAEMEDVDAPTAAIKERARAALLVACDGWRKWRRCTDPDGTRVAHPHPECLAAQYRYELILLENGIPR
jgi:hypothetical protein